LNARHHLLIDPSSPDNRPIVPAPYFANGRRYQASLLVCVSEEGNVTHVKLVRGTSVPLIDEQLPAVIARWRYAPFLIDGKPAKICYPLNYALGGS
jgi:TonB family protein